METMDSHEVKTICSKVKNIIPFSYLEETDLRHLVEQSRVEQYKAGSYILKAGDPSQKTLYFILEGQARAVAKIGIEESVATTWNEGYFFGVTVMYSEEPYPISMIAATDISCLLINLEIFQKALGQSEKFAGFFIKILASRLNELYLTFSEYNPGERIIEGPILRRKIADICNHRVVTADPEEKIGEIAKKMSSSKVSSVVITADDGKPLGIITEQDLVAKILSADNPNTGELAQTIMSENLVKVKPEDFSYQALLMMIKHNTSHIIVCDENDLLIGIITRKELIQDGRSGALSVVKGIDQQDTFSGLAEVIREVDLIKQALLADRAHASVICAIISELYDRVTRKIVEMAVMEMISNGKGEPPSDFTFISMGSAGRMEQFTRTDQDNGIIFADNLADNASEYFLEIGKIIVRGLEECGFKRCSGDVMAENPHWCLPLSLWKKRLEEWTNNLDSQNIRDMTIFLDFRFISGERELFSELKDFTRSLFMKANHAQLFMAEDDLKHRASLNMFGGFITEKKESGRRQLNLKHTAQVHMVDCLRLFALREGIDETNSFERIHRLRERKVFRGDEAEYMEAAYETMLMLRIKKAVENIKKGLEPDSQVEPQRLTKRERIQLKETILTVGRLQGLVAHAFHVQKK